MLGSFVEWERVCPEAGAARVQVSYVLDHMIAVVSRAP
jgi:hypothetical protein